MDNNVTISKYRHVSNMKDMQCYFYVNDISVTLGSRGEGSGLNLTHPPCLSPGDSGGSKKGGKKKGSSFQTVSAVFRVCVSATSAFGCSRAP